MWTLIFGAGLALAAWLLFDAHRRHEAILKDEFERRSEGGALQFDSWEEAKAHERKKKRIGSMQAVALLLILICFPGLVVPFIE